MVEKESLDDIEKKLCESLGSGIKEWQAIALLLSKVEQEKLWAANKYHSFSAWLESLPGKLQVSIGWLWRIHKASKCMVSMHLKKYPDDEGSFEKIREKYPRTSATALEYASKIAALNPPQEVYQNIEVEVLGGTASVTVLKEKFKQYSLAAQSRSNFAHLLASCYELPFLSIVKLGHKDGPLEKQKTTTQKVTADLAPGSLVDLVVTIPQLDDVPVICGVITQDKVNSRSFDTRIFDRVFFLCDLKDRTELERDDIDRIRIDIAGKKFRLEQASNARKTDLSQKLALCARLYGSTLNKQQIMIG